MITARLEHWTGRRVLRERVVAPDHAGSPDKTPGMLHVVYRSYGGENRKGRPPYYSKLLALTSFVRALSQVQHPCEVIYLNDGPIPADRTALMERTGEILWRENLGCAGSMRAALELPVLRNWHPDDLVWFAEEDYLYLPDALDGVLAAARRHSKVAYFGLYASFGDRGPDGKPLPPFARVPPNWHPSQPETIGGHRWCRALSTTSTFGVRVGALRDDLRLMRIVMETEGAWDHTTCLMYQGHRPFSWWHLRNHFGTSGGSWKSRLRSVTIRAGLNLWQILRALSGTPARVLVAADPALATHLETDHLAVGTDWAQAALECAAWAEAIGASLVLLANVVA